MTHYREINDSDYGVKRVALWPKVFSKKELEQMKKAEEERLLRAAEEAEKKRLAEEEAAAKANPKGKKGADKKDVRATSRGPPTTSQSARSL